MKKLEARKGPFTFFALFKPDDSSIWDLVISAPWLESDSKLVTLKEFVKEIVDEFGEAELLHVIPIMLTLRDESLRRILDEVGTLRKPIEKTGVELFDLPIHEAYIMKARRPRIAAKNTTTRPRPTDSAKPRRLTPSGAARGRVDRAASR